MKEEETEKKTIEQYIKAFKDIVFDMEEEHGCRIRCISIKPCIYTRDYKVEIEI